MSEVTLHAPLAGWVAPLDEVPDPVFAERMMGEGIAIDPLEGLFRAPCDAEIRSVAPTRHSVTLGLANGAEIVIHVGLETVALGGEGFITHVEAGQKVRTGDPLIEVDLDLVARRAKSLLTPIVLVSEQFAFAASASGRLVAAGEPIALVRGEKAADAPGASADTFATATIVIPMAHGLHARPSAEISAAMKAFDAELEVSAHGKKASGRSIVGLMSLGLRHGDAAMLNASGNDARAALVAIVDLVENERDEMHGERPSPVEQPQQGEGPLLRGVPASPGLAIGPAARIVLRDIAVREDGVGVEQEKAALDEALRAVARELTGGSIAAAHRALLDDPELVDAACAGIDAGRSAGFAWRAAIDSAAAALRATGDPLLAERVDDLKDVERRVLTRLAGETAEGAPELPQGAILIADTLLPSQFMALDPARLGGICTARGGPTSHVAIMASSAGVPMLVAAGEAVLRIADGATLVLDASAGTLDTAPEQAALAAAEARLGGERARKAAELSAAGDDCRMADGTRIEIFANLASAAEAARAVAAGAEGCGLLRTEFLFHDRSSAPSEEEQRSAYADVAAALGGRPLIIRTLDAGADKPLPYLPMAHEDNPALGQRGVRLSLARPDLLAAQLRGLLRAAPAGDIRVMVPMIVDAGELRQVRVAMETEARALGVPMLPLGIMVETPAAALLADSLAAEADFVSIGTNDLSQYALAADRGNPATAGRIDALHPAVLRLIDSTAKGACKHKKWVGVCGGVASDPLAAAILIGLGVDELSATPAAIPALKQIVRGLRLSECRALAEQALAATSAEDVRHLATEAMATEREGAA